MLGDLDGFLHVPLVVAKANEDEALTVQAHAKQAVEDMAVLDVEVAEAQLDLFDDLLRAGGIELGAEAGARVGGVLVFDDDARVDGIDPALGDGVFVLAFDLFEIDAGFLLDERQLRFDLDLDFFLVIGQLGGVADVVGELRGLPGDKLIKRLGLWHAIVLKSNDGPIIAVLALTSSAPDGCERWLLGRLRRDDALERMSRHTLVHPIRHGARVVLPRTDIEQPVFEEWAE